jgi:hypothetical protein
MGCAYGALPASHAMILSGGGTQAATPAEPEHRVKVLTFNVLASIWSGAA